MEIRWRLGFGALPIQEYVRAVGLHNIGFTGPHSGEIQRIRKGPAGIADDIGILIPGWMKLKIVTYYRTIFTL